MKEPQQITKEPQQITKEPQGEDAQPPSGAQPAQQITKEPQRVTTKNPKKVEAGKRLAESNRKRSEAKKQAKLEASGVNQYYGIGAVIALGVIGGLGYYTFISLRKEGNHNEIILNHTHNNRPTSLRWIKSFLYYKMDKKSIVNDLYQVTVISVFAVGYSMLGKKILKMAPPSIQKFDLEDTGKLVAIVAASEMTREYLIKQEILPDHINV